MKLTLIYNDVSMDRRPRYNFAVGHLAASLKEAGHTVSLLHFTAPVSERDLVDAVQRAGPDLLGFTSTTNTFRHDKAMAKAIKRHLDLPIICGGVHPTLRPHETLAEDGIDMICVGEGDRAVVELCDRMEQGGEISDIPNIWSKRGGRIVQTPLRALIEDLDQLPFADRMIFDYEGLEESTKGYARVMISRGCPYGCTYCCNHKIKALYRKMGRFVRVKSVARVVQELEALLGEYPFVRYLIFYDSIFPLDREWLEEFAVEYPKRIGIPFSCNCRPELMTEEVARLLKTAGCSKVKFGIESGSETLRRDVLNREISQQCIRDAFGLCRDSGISNHSYNIIGLPFETPRAALDTIKLNAEINPDSVWRATFFPFPNTELFEVCQKNNMLVSGQEYDTYFEGTTLSQDSISEGQVNFLFQYFYALLRWYRLLGRLPPPLPELGDRATAWVMSSRVVPHGFFATMKKTAIKTMLRVAPGLMLAIMPPADE